MTDQPRLDPGVGFEVKKAPSSGGAFAYKNIYG